MRGTARRASGISSGVTLVELVAVIGLIGLILGVGLGFFATLRPGERAAVSLVQSSLRRASNAALQRAASAHVVLEPGGARFQAGVLRTVGTWHFEDKARVLGAFGLNATLDQGGEFIAGGWHGQALSFAGEPARAHVEIAVHEDPAWNFERGFWIEVALRRSGEGSAPILRIGQTIQLEVGSKGELGASFLSRVFDAQQNARAGERTTLRSGPGALAFQRWQLVRLGYDLKRFWLTVDGQELASVEVEHPVWKVEGPLLLGGGDRPFDGAIDALEVRAVESDQVLTLPSGVLFLKTAPARINFAAGGGLDPLLHNEPITLELEFADGRRKKIQVELAGTVQ